MGNMVFPSEATVLQDIKKVRRTADLKKSLFMDCVDVNEVAPDMRPELLEPRTQKMLGWIRNIQVQTKKALNEKIKPLPHDWDDSNSPEQPVGPEKKKS